MIAAIGWLPRIRTYTNAYKQKTTVLTINRNYFRTCTDSSLNTTWRTIGTLGVILCNIDYMTTKRTLYSLCARTLLRVKIFTFYIVGVLRWFVRTLSCICTFRDTHTIITTLISSAF